MRRSSGSWPNPVSFERPTPTTHATRRHTRSLHSRGPPTSAPLMVIRYTFSATFHPDSEHLHTKSRLCSSRQRPFFVNRVDTQHFHVQRVQLPYTKLLHLHPCSYQLTVDGVDFLPTQTSSHRRYRIILQKINRVLYIRIATGVRRSQSKCA